jgi:hypothetical protein
MSESQLGEVLSSPMQETFFLFVLSHSLVLIALIVREFENKKKKNSSYLNYLTTRLLDL